MRGFSALILLFLFSLVLTCNHQSNKEEADLVLINGTVWTVNPEQPTAEAVAVKGRRILEVGSSEEIQKLVGRNTQVIDLKGALLLPGFIDSHTHFLDGGFSLASIPLRGAKSREEFVTRMEEKVKKLEKGEWILRGNWDHQQFDSPQLPSKEWIDGITPHNPVCVSRLDGHMVLVNSLAFNFLKDDLILFMPNATISKGESRRTLR